MRRSNCLFFALHLFVTRGGYIAIRRSRHLSGSLHLLWSPDLKLWLHYTPIAPKATRAHAAIHKIWYRGKIVRGDP